MKDAKFGMAQIVTAEMREDAAADLDDFVKWTAAEKARSEGALEVGDPNVEWEQIANEHDRVAAENFFGYEVRVGDWLARTTVWCKMPDDAKTA
jgi:hypothetical protein